MVDNKKVCYICGRQMQDFDIIDPETGEKVATETACPDEWKQSHDRGQTGASLL